MLGHQLTKLRLQINRSIIIVMLRIAPHGVAQRLITLVPRLLINLARNFLINFLRIRAIKKMRYQIGCCLSRVFWPELRSAGYCRSRIICRRGIVGCGGAIGDGRATGVAADRRLLHVEVTDRPTAIWLALEIIRALPQERRPAFLIRDNDGAYGAAFRHALADMGVEDRPIRPHSHWQNGHVERLIGSLRRECLDHVIILSASHLRRILREYADYYNHDRTHLSLGKDAPAHRPSERLGKVKWAGCTIAITATVPNEVFGRDNWPSWLTLDQSVLYCTNSMSLSHIRVIGETPWQQCAKR
jgi:hypothetical protein